MHRSITSSPAKTDTYSDRNSASRKSTISAGKSTYFLVDKEISHMNGALFAAHLIVCLTRSENKSFLLFSSYHCPYLINLIHSCKAARKKERVDIGLPSQLLNDLWNYRLRQAHVFGSRSIECSSHSTLAFDLVAFDSVVIQFDNHLN